MAANADCRIAVVVASRNDGHHSDIAARMETFVRALDGQAAKHGLALELVLVDWNPPPERPRLSAVLPAPTIGSPLRVRHVVVPEAVHRRWQLAAAVPFFQWMAKNAGIRRAAAEYVIATNTDVLLSDELCHFLKTANLDPTTLYRANRCDVPMEVLLRQSVQQQLDFCRANVLQRYGMSARWSRRSGAPRGWLGAALSWMLTCFRGPGSVNRASAVDTDGCGDFTMMAKLMWLRIRGYPELPSHAYVDSLACHAAVASGSRQVVLPPECCVYHVDHPRGWASMSLHERLKLYAERPSLDHPTYQEAERWMWEHRRPLELNGEDWGCAGIELEEVVVERAGASSSG